MSEKSVLSFTLNGKTKSLNVHPMARLLDVIREDCASTGTKEGCGEGECGACNVIIDGVLVNSCLIPAIQADGCDILTVEGLATNSQLTVLQQAFWDMGGAQCGICTPGMLLSAHALLTINTEPTETEIRTALAGNLCRCTGYVKIVEAVQKAAFDLKNAPQGEPK